MATLRPAAPGRRALPDTPRPRALPDTRRSRALPEAPRSTGVRRTVGRASRTLVIALALLAVGSLGTLQVLQSSHVASVGYAIRALERERADLSAEVAQLEARVATRSNLEHVHDEAVTRLGMVHPEESISVSVDVAAPPVVPLPRRYVAPVEPAEIVQPGWFERFLGTLPGFD